MSLGKGGGVTGLGGVKLRVGEEKETDSMEKGNIFNIEFYIANN